MARPVRFRRSPHVVCYWKHGEFVFHNYATNRRAGASPLACEVLDACAEWQSLSHVYATQPGADRRALKRLVDTLVDLTFLHRSDRAGLPAEEAMARFERWNPEAGFFHTTTKDVRFADRRTAERLLKEQAADWPMPSPITAYPDAPTVALPAPSREGQLARTLLRRRTWRHFGDGPIALDTFATLLGLTAGVHHWVGVPGGGEVALKTSPSGGARHPVELYVLAWRIDGLDPGLYHYRADRHALEVLKPRAGRSRIAKYFPQAPYFERANAVVLFAAMYERDLWRYPYSRAYRAPLVEAGHLCQTFCLVATAQGLAPFSLMGLADSVIDADLGLDGVSGSVLYAAGVGVLPDGTDWAPAPPGLKAPPIRSNNAMRARAPRRRTRSR